MATAYSTLTRSQQQLYQSIVSKIESFQAEMHFQGFSFESISTVYKTVLEDHPEYFWLSGSSSATTTTYGSMISVDFRPEFVEKVSIGRIIAQKQRLDNKASELIALAKKKSAVLFEQILFLHDYLVLHSEYRKVIPHCYDAYGCLINGHAVCEGYAAAFQMLMNQLGVECGRVRGTSASNLKGEVSHVWNYVRLQDGYYYIDVTWDDPVISGAPDPNHLSHDYLGLNSREIQLTHSFASNQFIPNAIGTRYDYFRYFGYFAETYSFEVVSMIARKQLQYDNTFSVKFGSQRQLQLAVNELVHQQRVYSIPGMTDRISYVTSKSGLILRITRK